MSRLRHDTLKPRVERNSKTYSDAREYECSVVEDDDHLLRFINMYFGISASLNATHPRHKGPQSKGITVVPVVQFRLQHLHGGVETRGAPKVSTNSVHEITDTRHTKCRLKDHVTQHTPCNPDLCKECTWNVTVLKIQDHRTEYQTQKIEICR